MAQKHVATLIHGLTYFYGPRQFEANTPVVIDDPELAYELSQIVDEFPIPGGQVVTRAKFEVISYDEGEHKDTPESQLDDGLRPGQKPPKTKTEAKEAPKEEQKFDLASTHPGTEEVPEENKPQNKLPIGGNK